MLYVTININNISSGWGESIPPCTKQTTGGQEITPIIYYIRRHALIGVFSGSETQVWWENMLYNQERQNSRCSLILSTNIKIKFSWVLTAQFIKSHSWINCHPVHDCHVDNKLQHLIKGSKIHHQLNFLMGIQGSRADVCQEAFSGRLCLFYLKYTDRYRKKHKFKKINRLTHKHFFHIRWINHNQLIMFLENITSPMTVILNLNYLTWISNVCIIHIYIDHWQKGFVRLAFQKYQK